mgnify:CR=1 FL=1
MASSNIELYCKNEGITKLFLTGSEIERMKKEWITKLTEHLKAKWYSGGIWGEYLL